MTFSLVADPGVSPVYGATDYHAVVQDINVTSYTNPNGETLTAAQFGMTQLFGATVVNCPRGFVVNFTRVGKGTALKMTIAQDNAAASAAALPEIPNTTNFGTLTVLVFGK